MPHGVETDDELELPTLRELIRGSVRALALLDREFRYVLYSDRWLADYRLEDKPWHGISIYESNPYFPAHWRALHRSCLIDGELHALESEWVTGADRTAQWMCWNCRPWRNREGEVGGIVIASEIVTSRRETEAALKRANQRLITAQRLARIGYGEWQIARDQLTWSPEACEIFGMSAEHKSLSLSDYHSVIPESERERVREQLRVALATGIEEYELEHEIVRPDGSRRHVVSIGQIERDASKNPIYVRATVQDVTDRRTLAEQLRHAQKLEGIGRLAGGVAHEFNNLLTAIFGFADFALQGIDPKDSAREDIESIIASATQAKALTQQLLALSRQQPVSPRVVSLNTIVRAVEVMTARSLGEDIAYEVKLSDELWNVRVDPQALQQVLVNLAVNARDAMPHGGTLRIETQNIVLSKNEYGAKGQSIPAGGYVAVLVSDSGVGMSDAVKSRIFEPFFTTKGPGVGTGLGLSTCYGIVQQADGYISVSSDPGCGTTFTVYLPRIKAPLDPEVQKHTIPLMPGSEAILLVEDNAKVGDLTLRVLQSAGYSVLRADSAEAALAMCEQKPVRLDLLLTDVVMPGKNGRELADELAQRFVSLRVLFMSGYSENAVLHRGEPEAGVVLLEKPFAPNALLRSVREVLDTSRPWRQRTQPRA
jgi:two-component system, cell cycle sensor histidine kinase and response regulator CckA